MNANQDDLATPEVLSRFVRQKTILLRTRKRDGTWVGTPVSIAVEDDHAFIRTYDKSWKSRRLRNFPEVRFASSTFRGTASGPEVHAHARCLEGDEAKAAARLIARKYPVLHGVLVPISHRLMRTRTLHFELSQFQEPQPGSDQPNPDPKPRNVRHFRPPQ